MSAPGALALSLSGPGALCVGARRSSDTLYVAARLSLSQSSALSRSLCRGPAVSVARPGALSLVSAPGALCVRARRSLCPGPAVSVSGPGALSVSGLCRAPALCVGARRSLCRGPAFLCQGPALFVSGPGVSVSGPGAICVGARRSLCPVSGPGALFCVGICVAPRHRSHGFRPRIRVSPIQEKGGSVVKG